MNDNMPNMFIFDDVTIQVEEMTPEDLGHIAESKAYCNEIEEEFGTNDIDEMLRQGIDYHTMHRYINLRHDLIRWGYKPEDWKQG